MNNTKNIVITALFAALICVLTIFPKLPLAHGYIHLGDCLIIAAAFFIGIYAVPAAAIGSALADILSGYFIYAPATFVIKGLMALAAYVIIKRKTNLYGFALGAVAAEIIMLAGYFVYELIIVDFTVALADSVFGLIQAAGGTVFGVIICYVLKKSGLKEKLF